MAITAFMARLKFGERTMIRNDPDLKLALRQALLDLEREGEASFLGKAPNMESVTNALWSYFVGLSTADADAFLAREFPRLEAFMRGEGPPAPSSPSKARPIDDDRIPSEDPPPSPRRGKRLG